MAQQITWRNINVPTLNTSGLAQAGQNIGEGLDRLSKTMQDEVTRQRDLATNKLLADVAAVNSLDGYDALRARFAADPSMLQGADSKAVWDALNKTDNRLRSDATDQLTYEQNARTEAERTEAAPYLQGLYSQTTTQGVDNWVKGLQGEELSAGALSSLVSAGSALRDTFEGDTKFNQGQNDRARTEDERILLDAGKLFVTDLLQGDDLNQAQAGLKAWADSVNAPAAVRDQLREDLKTRFNADTTLTPQQNTELTRKLEDIERTTEYANGLTFREARAQIGSEKSGIQRRVSQLPETFQDTSKELTRADLVDQWQGKEDLMDDTFLQVFDKSKEDMPALFDAVEDKIYEVYDPKRFKGENNPFYTYTKDKDVPQRNRIDNRLIDFIIRRAGKNDYEDNAGEITESSVMAGLNKAIAEYGSYMNQRQTLRMQEVAAQNRLQQLEDSLLDITRGVQDEADLLKAANRRLRN